MTQSACAGEVISAEEAAKRCDEYEEQQIKHMYLFQTRYSTQLTLLPAQCTASSHRGLLLGGSADEQALILLVYIGVDLSLSSCTGLVP